MIKIVNQTESNKKLLKPIPTYKTMVKLFKLIVKITILNI
jgi:hypothetical protein